MAFWLWEGYWLLAVGCWLSLLLIMKLLFFLKLLAFGCWLWEGYWLLAAGYWLLAVGFWLVYC
jgi:hypothetical protein